MRTTNLPVTGPRYWGALCVASVFGANLGDFVSHNLHLGHVRGLPVLAVLFGLLLLGERRGVLRGEATYWAVIVVLRTAATNLADLATHDLRLSYGWVVAVLAAALAVFCLPGARLGGMSGQRGDGMPAVGGWYWAAMLTAGTMGTALGDVTADELGLGTGPATIVLGAVLAVLLTARRIPDLAALGTYWMTIIGVRAAGTTLADFLDGRGGLALGLPVSTTCTGLALVATLLLWRARPRAEAALPAQQPSRAWSA